MIARQPRYSKEEFARRGTALYEQQIRPLVEQGNLDRIIAIDIDTGDYQLADDPLEACKPLIARRPDAQIWCVRIGHRAVERFGFHATADTVKPMIAGMVNARLEARVFTEQLLPRVLPQSPS